MVQQIGFIFSRVWAIEYNKFKRIGRGGLLIAFFILYLYFFALPSYVKSIWPEKIDDKPMFQLTVSAIMYIVSTPLCFLIYAPGYFGAKIYDKYQIEPSRKWPWKLPNWDYMKKRTFWNLILNNFVVFPLYIYLGLSLFGSKLIYEGFPTTYELIKSFFIIMVLDDTIFMIAHGLFHKIPFLYRFHKVHHEYVSVFSGIGQYAHPLELILGMSFPSTIMFSFYNVHIFMFFFWLTYKLYNSCEGHCGYDLPWSPARVIPFVYGASYHDFHHSKNVGNYATRFYLIELILGTNKFFFDIELKKSQNQLPTPQKAQ